VGYEDEQTTIGEETTAKLQAVARRGRLTMNTILQGAWGLLLSKYSGAEDLVFGTTVSGRPTDLRGSESIVGPFINTIPVRVRIPFHSSWLSWLAEIQNEQLDYGQYGYGSAVEQYSEVPLGIPLYESILIFQNYPAADSAQNRKRSVEVGEVHSPVRTKYPLTIISGDGSELPLFVAYDLGRFERPAITRLLAHLRRIIEGIANEPEQPIRSQSLMSRTEQEQLLAEWKDKCSDSYGSLQRMAPSGEAWSPHEEMLSAIWSELFGVGEFRRDHNFFEMGGHSLLATQLLSRVREVFNVEIPLRQVFEKPTIEGLAGQIEEAIGAGEREQAPPLTRAFREGRSGAKLPLSFQQQRLWFMDQLVPGNPFYNVPYAVRLEGRLDLETVARVINEIVRRHESLRTRIVLEEGDPAQMPMK